MSEIALFVVMGVGGLLAIARGVMWIVRKQVGEKVRSAPWSPYTGRATVIQGAAAVLGGLIILAAAIGNLMIRGW